MRRKPPEGKHTKPNVWDRARKLELWRGGKLLEPGVNFFVAMLEQMGIRTVFSCEGHPDGFYIVFLAYYPEAAKIHGAGFFTVEIEKPEYWSIRFGTERDREFNKTDALRWAAKSWEEHFGKLEFDEIETERS